LPPSGFASNGPQTKQNVQRHQHYAELHRRSLRRSETRPHSTVETTEGSGNRQKRLLIVPESTTISAAAGVRSSCGRNSEKNPHQQTGSSNVRSFRRQNSNLGDMWAADPYRTRLHLLRARRSHCNHMQFPHASSPTLRHPDRLRSLHRLGNGTDREVARRLPALALTV